MKLKKLELIGFKSFYDKTTFDFSAGVTAIVGPNGCGKSNIVDAIRWVLGEHAPSYLRSKALEDVIFAGSDAAGPLGMAEVTLTFVNDDGNAPPGYESYAEIAITRRTFRDGESEFSINKVPCRLKDIAELFLDTGAGARGYAIIAQGKVGEIVDARPDEMRMIIEEAAGVAKFRVRRKEAERKMESTRQNLARVKDILDEVRRQIDGARTAGPEGGAVQGVPVGTEGPRSSRRLPEASRDDPRVRLGAGDVGRHRRRASRRAFRTWRGWMPAAKRRG